MLARPLLCAVAAAIAVSLCAACSAQEHREHHSDGKAAGASCCFYSPNASDRCANCTSKAEANSWCAEAEASCTVCGGVWCGPVSHHTLPIPTPAAHPGPVRTPPPTHPEPHTPPPLMDVEETGDDNDADDDGAMKEQDEKDDPEPPAKPAPEPSSDNPFEGHTLYVNPTFQANIRRSIKTAAPGPERDNLIAMSTVASAYWLDVKSKVQSDDDSRTDTAAGILRDAASHSPAPLVTFIVYNLPNRDCMAKASNGEVCCGASLAAGNCDYLDGAMATDCPDGLRLYQRGYIDPLAATLRRYCGRVPLALVIEPDSLPNLVTNAGSPRCGSAATRAAYRAGVRYAVQALGAACPAAAQYLDAAHGGWLGWPDNLKRFAQEVAALEVAPLLRGFALNVANYQPLGAACPAVGWCVPGGGGGGGGGGRGRHACCADPCGLADEHNVGHSELNYAAALADAASAAMPGFRPRFVIDTGRNARAPRANCAHWCNARGAGAGVRPTTQTALPALVDAYLWLKTPGESDGCTQTLPDGGKCPRFDADCASADSIGSRPGEPRCPEAGAWFDYQVKMLARNADI